MTKISTSNISSTVWHLGDARIKPNNWNFVAFSFDMQLKTGTIQVGDSYGYHEQDDFPVSSRSTPSRNHMLMKEKLY